MKNSELKTRKRIKMVELCPCYVSSNVPRDVQFDLHSFMKANRDVQFDFLQPSDAHGYAFSSTLFKTKPVENDYSAFVLSQLRRYVDCYEVTFEIQVGKTWMNIEIF